MEDRDTIRIPLDGYKIREMETAFSLLEGLGTVVDCRNGNVQLQGPFVEEK